MTEQTDEKKESKIPEIIATSLAGLTSAYLGSFFGVAGTTIGLAFGSLVSGLATEYYKHALKRANDSIKSRLAKKKNNVSGPRDIRITEQRADGYTRYFQGVLLEQPKKTSKWKLDKINWKWALAAMAITFIAGFGGISIIELAKGSPISGGNSGTTLSGLLGNPTQTSTTKQRPAWAETITNTETSTESYSAITTSPKTTTEIPSSTTTSLVPTTTQQSSESAIPTTSSAVPNMSVVTPTDQQQIPQTQNTTQ